MSALLNIGSAANDGTGDPLRTAGQKLNRLPNPSSTINADSGDYVGTTEQKITLAIVAAVAAGAKYVFVPQSMLPYNASLVTFNNAVKMIGEGLRQDVWHVRAYGADPTAVTDQSVAVQATVNAVPLSGGIVYTDQIIYLGATVVLPIDRLVVLEGLGDFGTNVNGLLSSGSGYKRVSTFTSGSLFSQTGAGASSTAYGVQIRHLGFDGNNVAGDLVALTQIQGFRISFCTFFNSNGNGILSVGGFNWWIEFCKFMELGNTTAYPNGTAGIFLKSNANAGCVDGWITQCQWESGRGSYLLAYDPTGTHPVDGVAVLGGKMEWTGNASTGFDPPFGSAIGMPFLIPGNGTNWLVYGLFMVGGGTAAATHILVTNCSYSRFYTNHATPSGQPDNKLPTYFIDLFAGTGCYVSGIFQRGAQIASAGAHIRVVESSFVGGYQIDPGSQFISPASGTAIKFVNPTTGAASFFPASGGIRDKVFTVNPAIATQPINVADGNAFEYNITSNIAVVIQAPSSAPASSQSQTITVTFFNNSGGALGTAPTFATGSGAFLTSAAVVNPANGTGVTYEFRWSPTAAGGARFRETGRTVAF